MSDLSAIKSHTNSYNIFRLFLHNKKRGEGLCVSHVPKTTAALVIELKEVRVSLAKREGIKPYMIFTDRQLDAIIEAKPISERELAWIEGFDEEKAFKYGKEISRIFRYL